MRYRACGRLLVRRLEPEAGGPSGIRLLAVAARPWGRATEQAAGHLSAAAGCAERTIRQSTGSPGRAVDPTAATEAGRGPEATAGDVSRSSEPARWTSLGLIRRRIGRSKGCWSVIRCSCQANARSAPVRAARASCIARSLWRHPSSCFAGGRGVAARRCRRRSTPPQRRPRRLRRLRRRS